jgi:hypothetical protein
VDREDVVIGVGSGNAIQINRHPSARPALGGQAAAGVIDKNAAYRFRRGGEK